MLLGDVVFRTDATLQRIADDDCDLRFFGTRWELFALTFDAVQDERVTALLHSVDNPGQGKLWHTLRATAGCTLNEHEPDLYGDWLTMISDGSDDVDTWSAYTEMCRVLKQG